VDRLGPGLEANLEMQTMDISSPGLSEPSEPEGSWPSQVASAMERFKELDDSFVLDLFQGLYESKLLCEACGYTSSTFEVFTSLSVPILADQGNTGLEECLRYFTSAESLEGGEFWLCERCQESRRATKKITLIRDHLPAVLVVHLKRFTPMGQKLFNLVQYPVEALDMAPFCMRNDNSIEPTVYDLVGVTRHLGSTLQAGHYVADVLCSDRNWRVMNDEESRLLRSAPDGCDPDAYMLYYVRRRITD